MKNSAPILETERLILREISEGDTDQIVRWRSNPAVYCYFVSPHKITVQEHNAWYQNRYSIDSYRYDFMAVLKDDDRNVGVFGVKYSPKMQSVEISYLLDQQMQSKGYGKEAMNAAISFAESNWNPCILIAEIHLENVASIRFAENLGMKLSEQKGAFLIYKKSLQE